MPARTRITVNGREFEAESDQSLAAFLLNIGVTSFRKSVNGGQRAPLCGMGICFDCRVTVDSTPHVRACMVKVVNGMEVRTEV